MIMTIPDIIGLFGVFFILLAYGLLQFERIKPTDWRYSALNGLGASLILISLYYDFNLPTFVIEAAWVVISLFGLWKAWRARNLKLNDVD